MKHFIFLCLIITAVSGQPYKQGYSFTEHQHENPSVIVYNQQPPIDLYHDYWTTLFGVAIGLIPSLILFWIQHKSEKKKEKRNEKKQLIEKLKLHKVEASLTLMHIKDSIGWIRYYEVHKEYNSTKKNYMVHKSLDDLKVFKTFKDNMEIFRRHIEFFESEIGEIPEWNKLVDRAVDYEFIFNFQHSTFNSEDDSDAAIFARIGENNVRAHQKINDFLTSIQTLCNFMNKYIDDLRNHVK